MPFGVPDYLVLVDVSLMDITAFLSREVKHHLCHLCLYFSSPQSMIQYFMYSFFHTAYNYKENSNSSRNLRKRLQPDCVQMVEARPDTLRVLNVKIRHVGSGSDANTAWEKASKQAYE